MDPNHIRAQSLDLAEVIDHRRPLPVPVILQKISETVVVVVHSPHNEPAARIGTDKVRAVVTWSYPLQRAGSGLVLFSPFLFRAAERDQGKKDDPSRNER